MTTLTYSALLFDLDGTILDSAPIICDAMSRAMADFGHDLPPSAFEPFIGPPPWHTFAELTGEPSDVVERMVPHYRGIYDSLMDRTPAFQGMPELLERLARAGAPMAIATSKLRSAAISLAENAGIAKHFVSIQGAGDTADSADKATVIGQAVADLEASGADTSALLMIGDRHHDLTGAATRGIPTVLVEWGYAEPDEFEGAVALAASPQDLGVLLGV